MKPTEVEWREILGQGIKDYERSLTSFNSYQFENLNNPRLGDLVYEISHPDKDLGFGFYLGGEYNGGWPKYKLLNIFTRKVMSWENCKFIRIAQYSLYAFPEYKEIEKQHGIKELDGLSTKSLESS